MDTFKPQVLLRVSKLFVHDGVDVRVVVVKKLLDIRRLRVVDEQPKVLKIINIIIILSRGIYNNE